VLEMDYKCLRFKAFTNPNIMGFASLWLVKGKYEVTVVRKAGKKERICRRFGSYQKAKEYFELRVLEFQILSEL